MSTAPTTHYHHGPKTTTTTTLTTLSTASYPSPDASYDQITQNSQFFFDKLHSFHSFFGTKFKIPIIGGSSLDLHRLFIEVTSRGGFEKIVSDRRWREVMAVFKFGPTITNASFVLRKAYLSLLYHFEQVYFFRKKSPTLSADSTNRLSHGPVSGSVKNLLSARQKVEVGGQVTGTIDNRFEQGYLVTVDLGNEKLSGGCHTQKNSSFMGNSHARGTTDVSGKVFERRKDRLINSLKLNRLVLHLVSACRLWAIFFSSSLFVDSCHYAQAFFAQVYNVSAELLGTKGAVYSVGVVHSSSRLGVR
nr:high mobility group B protein 10 [Tanacetum cinerariifolium]